LTRQYDQRADALRPARILSPSTEPVKARNELRKLEIGLRLKDRG
jgi:hypothetical protein